MNFISEDKKTINLPVSLGTTVYRIITSCNDACTFQKEKFDKVFPSKGNRCGQDMPCHIKLHSIQPVKLKLSNVEWILTQWNISIFETENKAREIGERMIKEHKQKLLELGLVVS